MTLSHSKIARLMLSAASVLAIAAGQAGALEVFQSITDDFSDGDRNNDGAITVYDTDVNLSGTLNTSPDDDVLNTVKNLTEVTAPESGAIAQSGLVWSATRGFTSSNTGDPKANLKIFDDTFGRTDTDSGTTELDTQVHGTGYALGVESKGTGSSLIGAFPQAIELGPSAGDKVVVSLDWRFWRLANNASSPPTIGEMRWGIWQDTDNEFGQVDDVGLVEGGVAADAEWGADDGDWRSNEPGPEGDKGIYTRLPLGPSADVGNARINWEYNLAGINGTSNNGRFFEGSGVSNDPGVGGDVGTVASPTNDGPGGSVPALGTHELSMEITRLADGLVEVASFVNGAEILRDEIKTTDTGFGLLGPPADTYNYIGFRNSSGDYDYVIDNVVVQSLRVPEPSAVVALFSALAVCSTRRRRS